MLPMYPTTEKIPVHCLVSQIPVAAPSVEELAERTISSEAHVKLKTQFFLEGLLIIFLFGILFFLSYITLPLIIHWGGKNIFYFNCLNPRLSLCRRIFGVEARESSIKTKATSEDGAIKSDPRGCEWNTKYLEPAHYSQQCFGGHSKQRLRRYGFPKYQTIAQFASSISTLWDYERHIFGRTNNMQGWNASRDITFKYHPAIRQQLDAQCGDTDKRHTPYEELQTGNTNGDTGDAESFHHGGVLKHGRY